MPSFFRSLPAAIHFGPWWSAILAALFWPVIYLFLMGIGLTVNCAPLAHGLGEAGLRLWREPVRGAAAYRLAIVMLLGYPFIRTWIDPIGNFFFQLQRYHAHLTPICILLVVGAVPMTGALSNQPGRWDWRGIPLALQVRRALRWTAAGTIFWGLWAMISVGNINDMQADLGRWLKDRTAAGQVVATNDIGAIGFFSERKILDTVGLIEPRIVEHYLAGGELADYLVRQDPAYVAIFPKWYPELARRRDLLQEVRRIRLPLNLVSGGIGLEMVVYRPLWTGRK